MPRRALRCIVDFQLHALSAPGVWLPSKEDVYISVSLFNQYRNTRLLTSIFPLIPAEKFRFEKTYYTAVDPSHVTDMLDDELVIFELVQLSEYTDGAVRLASYSTNARDFLFPYPNLCPSYSTNEREVLMCRTIAFPGISPKLEFSTKTVIQESISPELDALDDALHMERESRKARRSRARSAEPESSPRRKSSSDAASPCGKSNQRRKECWTEEESIYEGCPPHYRMPTISSICRSRSPSPSMRRKLADINISSTIDPRPPFVVRKLEHTLIGRKPGTDDKHALSKKKRSVSPFRHVSIDDFNVSYNATPRYRPASAYLGTYKEPTYKTRYSTLNNDDIDKEVEALTSLKTTPIITPRPRSVSPLLYRSTFRTRYGDTLLTRPYSPTYYERLIAREEEIARARRINRLYGTYYPSMDDLELDLRLARIRAGIY